MGRAQQFLHPGMGGQSYLDTFAVVGPRWTARAGTLAAGLQAATAGDWLGNMLTDGGLEAAYVAGLCSSLTKIGSPTLAESADAHGGAKAQAFTPTALGDELRIAVPSRLVGATYVASQWAKRTAGAVGNVENLYGYNGSAWVGKGTYITSAIYTLRTLSILTLATVVNPFRICATHDAGPVWDTVVIDDVSCYRQNTVATIAWGSPNIQITLDLAIPAAPSVVPFSAVVRYTDTLNYWEVRTTPNTAGNDLEIIEVVAGVETVRASADIDWTAGGTDLMRINVYGTTTAVEVKKSGAAGFTAACSYTTMATGAAAVDHGLMFYGTGVNRCTRWLSC